MKTNRRLRRVATLILTFIMCLVWEMSAQAGTNPLKSLTSKYGWIISSPVGKGCEYFTPEYNKNFKMTVTSSNKKAATVKVYSYRSQSGKYFKGFDIIVKGPGKTNIKVTIEVNGKKYSKTIRRAYYEYENPFSSFKIGGKEYKSKLNKLSADTGIFKWKTPAGKLRYKLKNGYKINSIWYWTSGYRSRVDVKNGDKIPKKASLWISYQNKKTKANGCIHIYHD